jgi:hypothetical protein
VKQVVCAAVLATALVLGGCAASDPLLAAKGYDVTHPQFADIPVPEGFKYIKEKSYRFEYDWKNVRHGRLIYRGTLPVPEVISDYQEKMITANWVDAGSSERGAKMELVYEKGSGTTKERCLITIYSIGEMTIVEVHLDPVK